MNADMLNRGTEDPPPVSLSLLEEGTSPPPPLDPPLHTCIVSYDKRAIHAM